MLTNVAPGVWVRDYLDMLMKIYAWTPDYRDILVVIYRDVTYINKHS